MKATILAAMAAASLPMMAHAQAAPASPVCASVDAALPPELSAWSTKAALVSAVSADTLPGATLAPGKAVTAGLHPTREVTYPLQPEKPGGSVAKGGLFRLPITTAGVYRVALGSGAWIDMLEAGKPVESSAHTQGPACTTVRKIVDFPLNAGEHLLQISGNTDPTVGILVVSKP